MIWRRI